MFIGLIAFSFLNPSGNTKVKDGDEKTKAAVEADATETSEENGKTNADGTTETGMATEAAATETVAATEAVTEATAPAVITATTDEKIKSLVVQYLDASCQADMDALEDMVTDVTKIDENVLKATYANVESIQNVECYLAEGVDAASHVVYVYFELKLKDIATMAPGLNRIYVITGDDGNYRVYLEEDAAVLTRIAETDQSAEVQALVQKVNLKMEEAASLDADLKAYNDSLASGTPATETTPATEAAPATEATVPPTEAPQEGAAE